MWIRLESSTGNKSLFKRCVCVRACVCVCLCGYWRYG